MATAANEAILADGTGRLRRAPVAMPDVREDEALVAVEAFSLNRGDVRRALAGGEPSFRPGYDLAGTVVRPAASGIGPGAGARVVGLVAQGSWSRFVAVPAGSLAVLPDAVATTVAACLPVAGLTAWCALRHGGLLLGRRVLVTGASGGVGDFAVQMARLSGAGAIVAHLRDARQAEDARAAGASAIALGETLEGAAQHAPFDLIVDGVNGRVLARALDMLAPGGVAAVYGSASGERLEFDLRRFFRAGRTALCGIALFEELRGGEGAGAALARLVGLVAAGGIRPRIALEAGWDETDRLAEALMQRRFSGKAVLHVAEGDASA